jgi:hypothetical protein
MSDARANIFYDYNDTGYYADPNATSRMSRIDYTNLYYYADTSYGFIGVNVYADTINSGIAGDQLELCYYKGTFTSSSGSMRAPLFYDRDDTGYYADPNSTSRMSTINADVLRSYTDVFTDNNYGYGHVGVYNSTVFQGVFSMGTSYRLTAAGAVGNLYGMCWSHPNAGGAAGNLDSHGMIVLINGGFGSCMSYSIKASGNVTAYSDERLKTNWRSMPENFVAQLAKVKVGRYERLDGEKLTQVGVSAQSLQLVLPEAVTTADDDIKTLSVSYGNAALASAVELAKEVVALKEKLSSQEERISKLESLLNNLQ